mmetsp:Transcript_108912/g.303680  ORF Transcript_108912/g.303680 Transcript_108912/m.303680 type:complete len:394 (+) Transcript_108912:68-1249(+)
MPLMGNFTMATALSLLLLFLSPILVSSIRDLSDGFGAAGRADYEARCNKMQAKLDFPSMTMEFEIKKYRREGATYEVKCGDGTGTPDEVVTFKCTDTDGTLAWKWVSGECKSREQVTKDGTPTCPATEYIAEWTVGGKKVPITFAMEAMNPTGEDQLVNTTCPEGTPGAGKAVQFTCSKDGKWDFSNGEATKVCIGGAGSAAKEHEEEYDKGTLPCELALQHVVLVGGEAGFDLMITCHEPITDSRLKVLPSNSIMNFEAEVGKPVVITTLKTAKFVGKELVVQAKHGGVPGSLSVTVEEERQAEEGSLPCALSKRDVTLKGGAQGFTITIKCSKPITDAKLKLPGFQDRLFGDIAVGTFLLTTQDAQTFKGKHLSVEGKSEGIAGSTNIVEI